MYQRAEICLPRKKKVLDSFRSNTYRVFDENVPDRLNPSEFYKDHKYASRDGGEVELLKTHNVPQPYNAKFIRTNVRFLNEPIAHIETDSTMAEQFKWWSNTVDKDVAKKTVYSKDSTQRSDYQAITYTPVTRVNKERIRPPATGIIPTLSPLGEPKELVEHMSFTHQFDSRRLDNQPNQGNNQGVFVWRERGATGLGAFHNLEGLNSSQHAPLSLSPQQMYESTGALSIRPGPDARGSNQVVEKTDGEKRVHTDSVAVQHGSKSQHVDGGESSQPSATPSANVLIQ